MSLKNAVHFFNGSPIIGMVKPGNDISDRREKYGKLPARITGESLEADYKLEEIVGQARQ